MRDAGCSGWLPGRMSEVVPARSLVGKGKAAKGKGKGALDDEPLIAAACSDDVARIQALLADGASVNT